MIENNERHTLLPDVPKTTLLEYNEMNVLDGVGWCAVCQPPALLYALAPTPRPHEILFGAHSSGLAHSCLGSAASAGTVFPVTRTCDACVVLT